MPRNLDMLARWSTAGLAALAVIPLLPAAALLYLAAGFHAYFHRGRRAGDGLGDVRTPVRRDGDAVLPAAPLRPLACDRPRHGVQSGVSEWRWPART